MCNCPPLQSSVGTLLCFSSDLLPTISCITEVIFCLTWELKQQVASSVLMELGMDYLCCSSLIILILFFSYLFTLNLVVFFLDFWEVFLFFLWGLGSLWLLNMCNLICFQSSRMSLNFLFFYLSHILFSVKAYYGLLLFKNNSVIISRSLWKAKYLNYSVCCFEPLPFWLVFKVLMYIIDLANI